MIECVKGLEGTGHIIKLRQSYYMGILQVKGKYTEVSVGLVVGSFHLPG